MAPLLPPPLSRPWPNGISHAYTLFHLRVHIVRSSVYRCARDGVNVEYKRSSAKRKEKKKEEKREREREREEEGKKKHSSRLEIVALGESVGLDVLFAFCEIRFLGKGERERDKLASGSTLAAFICLFICLFV